MIGSGSASSAPADSGEIGGLVRIAVTRKLIESDTDAIAVVGLSYLKAHKRDLRRIELPEYEGHLWLGDHGCFWPKHQMNDRIAAETYQRVREALVARPDDYEGVEAGVDETATGSV